MNFSHFCCLNFIFALLLFQIVVKPSYALHESGDSRIMDVSCHRSGLTVKIQLPSNFSGVIYSLNNFFNPSCRYDVKPVSTNTNFSVFLPIDNCDIFIEEVYDYIHFSSVIVLQKYSFAETAWDELHNLSCKILQYEVKRNFELENNSYRFLNNNLESWMEFKIGSDVYKNQQIRELKVGDDVLIIVQLKDGGQNKDVHIESCWAYEEDTVAESKYVMQIFDSRICQPSDWITAFSTTRGIQNVSNIMTYATLKVFKFPSTESLQISCSVSVCHQNCLRHCNVSPEVGRTDKFHSRKHMKRSASRSVSSKFANERLRLMKATIKALGVSLLRNRTSASFYKRKLQPTIADIPVNDGRVFEITATDRDDFDSIAMVDILTSDSTETNSNSVSPVDHTVDSFNDIYNFNLTMNLVVLSDRNTKFSYVFGASKFGSDCVPRVRFSLVISMLCFILFCLILTCIALVLYLRKEKKKHLIDNFLLYNFY